MMGFPGMLVLGLGLAMDATAVSASCGLAAKRGLRWRDVALVALLFGGFQAAMPALGWLGGTRIGPLIADWDHWLAFALLLGIGGKMAWEGIRGGADAIEDANPFRLRLLLPLAVATSIDALAVGVALPTMGAPLLPAIATIGVVTAALSAVGIWAGRRFGERLGARLDVLGGVVLVGLGVKILVEHLSGAA